MKTKTKLLIAATLVGPIAAAYIPLDGSNKNPIVINGNGNLVNSPSNTEVSIADGSVTNIYMSIADKASSINHTSKVETKKEILNRIRNKLRNNKATLHNTTYLQIEGLINSGNVIGANSLLSRELDAPQVDDCMGDTGLDIDGDNISNLNELKSGLNPNIRDSDGGGHNDNIEISSHTVPLNRDNHPSIIRESTEDIIAKSSIPIQPLPPNIIIQSSRE